MHCRQDEVAVACKATVEQVDPKYADGGELGQVLQRCRYCQEILAGYRGSVWRPLSRLHSSERRQTVSLAMAAVRARYHEAAKARRKIARDDRWHIVQLLLLGKAHFPFILTQMFFNIVSGSIQTMHRWQSAEVINFFTERQAGGTVNLDGFGNLLQGYVVLCAVREHACCC